MTAVCDARVGRGNLAHNSAFPDNAAALLNTCDKEGLTLAHCLFGAGKRCTACLPRCNR